jgi:HEPN domain-containing protein
MAEMSTHEYALEWLTYAETDLNSAEFLLNLKPLPVEVICYHCQQSAEKCLKGNLLRT